MSALHVTGLTRKYADSQAAANRGSRAMLLLLGSVQSSIQNLSANALLTTKNQAAIMAALNVDTAEHCAPSQATPGA